MSEDTSFYDNTLDTIQGWWQSVTDFFSSDAPLIEDIPANNLAGRPPVELPEYTYATSPDQLRAIRESMKDASAADEIPNPKPVFSPTSTPAQRQEQIEVVTQAAEEPGFFRGIYNNVTSTISGWFGDDQPIPDKNSDMNSSRVQDLRDLKQRIEDGAERAPDNERIMILSSLEDLIRKWGGDYTPGTPNRPKNTPLQSAARLFGKEVSGKTTHDIADVLRGLAFFQSAFGGGNAMAGFRMHALGDALAGHFNMRDTANTSGFPYLATFQPYLGLLTINVNRLLLRKLDEMG